MALSAEALPDMDHLPHRRLVDVLAEVAEGGRGVGIHQVVVIVRAGHVVEQVLVWPVGQQQSGGVGE